MLVDASFVASIYLRNNFLAPGVAMVFPSRPLVKVPQS